MTGRSPAESTKFTASLQYYSLYMALIRDVALVAADGDEEAALHVHQAAWDRARKSVERDGPKRAQSMVKCFGVKGWQVLLDLAFTDPTDRSTVASASAPRTATSPADSLAFDALKMFAFQDGATPLPSAFDQRVSALEKQRRAAYGYELGIPVSATLIKRFKSWDAVCEAAGVDSPVRRQVTATASMFELIYRCVEMSRAVPDKAYFTAWCKASGERPGVAIRDFGKVLEEVRATREEIGLRWPEITTKEANIDPVELASAWATKPPVHGRVTLLDALESMRRYARYVPPNVAPTQKGYNELRATYPDIGLISAKAITKFSTFGEMYEAATRFRSTQ